MHSPQFFGVFYMSKGMCANIGMRIATSLILPFIFRWGSDIGLPWRMMIIKKHILSFFLNTCYVFYVTLQKYTTVTIATQKPN